MHRRINRRTARFHRELVEFLENRRLLNADIVVNTTADETAANATTSLREALVIAQTQAGDDKISFDPTVFTSNTLHTITLGAEPLQITAANGAVTITGPGTGVLAISSSTSGRAFDVQGNAIATISGTTLRDGTATGGAIYNQGILTLDGMLITQNVFQQSAQPNNPSGDGIVGADALGGAIVNTDSLKVKNSTISDNTAYGGSGGQGVSNGGNGGAGLGGGIYSSGDLTVESTTFSGNLASGGNGGLSLVKGGDGGLGAGGAIYMLNGNALSISGSLFSQNDAFGGSGAAGGFGAGGKGGTAIAAAIYSDAAMTLNASTFDQNITIGGLGAAGGLNTTGGLGGTAEAGAIYAGGPVGGTLNNLTSNKAQGGNAGPTGGINSSASGGGALGGAMFVSITASGSLEQWTFSKNIAQAGIGGSADSTHTGGSAGGATGGAIGITCPTFAILDSGFEDNQAQGGTGGAGNKSGAGGGAFAGGIYFNGSNLLSISGGHASGNSAKGGDDAAAALGNDAGQARGGGIAADGAISIFDYLINGNSALGGNGLSDDTSAGGTAFGGAISTSNTLSLEECTLTNNKASGGISTGATAGAGFGGGIYIEGVSLNVKTTTLSQNSATGNRDFGLAAIFAGGQAIGGAIFTAAGNTTINSSTIDHNTATGGDGNDATSGNGGEGGSPSGGGIYADGPFKLINSTLFANEATPGKGGNTTSSGNGGQTGAAFGAGLYSVGAVTLINNTITNNIGNLAAGGTSGGGGFTGTSMDSQGGGMHVGSASTLTNNIVANNEAIDSPDIQGTVNASHNLIENIEGVNFNTDTTNIKGVDPQLGAFGNNGGLTKTLLPAASNSPVIDKGDNAAALAEFTAGGFDQRGSGFPRFIGVVDIGAVEVRPPIIAVVGNGNTISNNDATPSAGDFTDFGTTNHGAVQLERLFFISNNGQLPLALSTPTLPAGYVMIIYPPATIDPGASVPVVIRLLSDNPGVFAGNVVINSNDPNTPTFKFRITGTITSAIKINFQPDAAPTPAGFGPDGGLIYANRLRGLTYGWNLNAASAARDRDILSDQSRDTFIHTQLYGNRTWEISLPNGAYQVHLVAGDAQYFNSVYKINAEGTLLVSGAPTNGSRFVEGTATIVVSDGKLTLSNASGAVNNKFDFVEITPVATPIKINFQPLASTIPASYLRDSGEVFGNRGNGQSYGWNLSAGTFSRDRNNAASPDQRYDTLIHTQLFGARTWELAVPNGQYQVHLVAGDPNFFDSVYKINVEGILTVTGTPTSGNRWIEGTKTVTVADGKLTVSNAAGSSNNKVAFIEVTAQ